MRWEIENKKEFEKQLLNYILDNIAEDIFTKSQENLVESFEYEGEKINQISDTGALLKSGMVERTSDNIRTVKYSIFYADYVEFGTLPHPISQEGQIAIYNWVRRKLGLSNKKAKEVAYKIIWKIRKKGTDPKPFLRNAVDYVIKEYGLKK